MTAGIDQQTKLRHDPPEIPGYQLHAREAIPIQRLTLWSIVAGVPWAIFFVAVGFVVERPEDVSFTVTLPRVLAFIFILLILVPIVHEAIHGLVAKIVGAKPFYGVGKGYAYTSFREPLSPRQYAVITVAPLAVLTLLSTAAFAIVPDWFLFVLVFATGNAAGAIGDLWILSRTWRLPSEALIYDLADGYAAFVPDGADTYSR